MKYAELQNKNIEELNERVETLGFSVRAIKENIEELKDSMGKAMVEHELAVLKFRREIDISRNALFELTLQKEQEQDELDKAHTMLDNSRFDAFRDDRGLSVESLPIGPLAIVPLGNSGCAAPSAKWTDEDAPNSNDEPRNIVFKKCGHQRKNIHLPMINGMSMSYNGSFVCNNCKAEEVVCYQCIMKD